MPIQFIYSLLDQLADLIWNITVLLILLTLRDGRLSELSCESRVLKTTTLQWSRPNSHWNCWDFIFWSEFLCPKCTPHQCWLHLIAWVNTGEKIMKSRFPWFMWFLTNALICVMFYKCTDFHDSTPKLRWFWNAALWIDLLCEICTKLCRSDALRPSIFNINYSICQSVGVSGRAMSTRLASDNKLLCYVIALGTWGCKWKSAILIFEPWFPATSVIK